MQYNREDSLTRSLLLPFGNGETSGSGIDLNQNAVRGVPAGANPGLQPLAERLTAIEQRIERAKATGAISGPGLLDERIAALTAQVEREIGEVEVKFKIQIEALNERDRVMAQKFSDEIGWLRAQVAALQRASAEALARLLEEQIDAGISARLAPLEARLREAVRSQVESASEKVTAELQRDLEVRDRCMIETMVAVSQSCAPTAKREPEPLAIVEPTSTAQTRAAEAPSFLQRVSFVGGFFLAAGALLLLHYL
jgi:hypothetical protein